MLVVDGPGEVEVMFVNPKSLGAGFYTMHIVGDDAPSNAFQVLGSGSGGSWNRSKKIYLRLLI